MAGVLGSALACLGGSGALEPPTPEPRPDRAVTVFVAGDSLAATYATWERPRAGWGQALELFLDDDVRVVDEAWPGASSRSFVEDGRLDAILAALEPGDLLLASFGHNDQEPDDRHTDPATSFRSRLRLFVDGARAAGATPVLVTPVERRHFGPSGDVVPTLGAYPAAMRVVADRTGTALVDLHAMSVRRWDRLGPAGTRAEFMWLGPGAWPAYPDGARDGTHLQAAGAVALGRFVAEQLERQGLLPPRAVDTEVAVDATDLAWPPVRPAAH